MTLPQNRKSFTIDEYHKLAEVGIIKETDRVELINGDIITMSPINSTHAGMVDLLMELLIVKLYKKATIKGQNPILLPTKSAPEPDIVIARLRDDFYSEKHPESNDIHVVIEVSDSTLDYDQRDKKNIYARANIQEYWIVNLIERQIEIYRQPKNGDYHFKQIISQEESFNCETIEFTLNYSDLFKTS